MKIEVWSDVVCPWCYIGKRRLEKAIGQFEHGDEVEVVWRSFQLDPSIPKGTAQPTFERLAEKFGRPRAAIEEMTAHVKELAAAEGLNYDFEHSVSVNTVDAHRVAHLAGTHGLGPEMHERLMRAQLIEGETINDVDTLARLGAEVGVPEEETRRVLAGDEYLAEVDADGREAQRLGATGVPFFVLDRTYGVSGAQSTDVFLAALREAHTTT